VGRFAKNFLPILFNVYSQRPVDGQPTSSRMAVLDTIKVYLTVTDIQMICTFLQNATGRLSNKENKFIWLSVMDLVVALAPCVDEVTMSKTYELIKLYLERGMQKKAYRVLEELCDEWPECQSFITANMKTTRDGVARLFLRPVSEVVFGYFFSPSTLISDCELIHLHYAHNLGSS